MVLKYKPSRRPLIVYEINMHVGCTYGAFETKSST